MHIGVHLTSHFFEGTRKARPCLTGHLVPVGRELRDRAVEGEGSHLEEGKVRRGRGSLEGKAKMSVYNEY